MMAMQKAQFRVFIREIRENRGSSAGSHSDCPRKKHEVGEPRDSSASRSVVPKVFGTAGSPGVPPEVPKTRLCQRPRRDSPNPAGLDWDCGGTQFRKSDQNRTGFSTVRTSHLIEETLRDKIAPKPPVAPRHFLRLTTVGGAGVRPGVDLNNSAALLAVMER